MLALLCVPHRHYCSQKMYIYIYFISCVEIKEWLTVKLHIIGLSSIVFLLTVEFSVYIVLLCYFHFLACVPNIYNASLQQFNYLFCIEKMRTFVDSRHRHSRQRIQRTTCTAGVAGKQIWQNFIFSLVLATQRIAAPNQLLCVLIFSLWYLKQYVKNYFLNEIAI